MAITDLYSIRQKKLNSVPSDIYMYDRLPFKLREQIIYIIEESITGNTGKYYAPSQECYREILNKYTREHGIPRMDVNTNFQMALFSLIRNEQKIEQVLDLIELSFHTILSLPNRGSYLYKMAIEINAAEAISELNYRFKESSIGYCFLSGQIIRIDHTLIHENITLPVLNLLFDAKFKNANDEYLSAQSHYKEGNNAECINECLKAFESTIKIIGHQKNWELHPKATASPLIKACFDNQLIPKYLQSEFESLKSLLEGGVPALRNQLGGHGAGVENKIATDELTRYALNLTGTSIIFLIEQAKIK
jgi:hypothetical protein